MLTRVSLLLAALILVAALSGCEGEQGPAGPTGPEGPPGPSVVFCFGTINQGVVESSWPSDVTITIAPVATGIWDVTLTGTFPASAGSVLTTVADNFATRSVTGYISSWSDTTIVFRVGICDILGSQFITGRFSFVVMAEEI